MAGGFVKYKHVHIQQLLAGNYPVIITGLLFFSLCFLKTAFACPINNNKTHTLGEYTANIAANTPLYLIVYKKNLELKLLREVNRQIISSFNPSGRYGYEMLYIPAQADNTQLQLCLLVKYQHSQPGSYQITPLKALKPEVSHAIVLMDKASQAWSENSQSSKLAAIAYYDQLARLNIEEFELSNYARLYSLNARILSYRYQEALVSAKELLAKVNITREPYLTYSAYRGKGKIQLRQGKYTQAISTLLHALDVAGSVGTNPAKPALDYKKDLTEIKTLLAEAYLLTGQLDKGQRLLLAAQAIAENDHQLLAAIYNNLGLSSLLKANSQTGITKTKHLHQAIKLHQLGRDYAFKAGDTLELTYIENNLATIYQRLGNLRQAREHYWQALNLIDASGSPLSFQVIYRNLGMIYQTLGDYQKSESFLKKAIELDNQSRSSPLDLSQLQCRLGNTQRQLGKIKAALANHTLCIRYATNDNNRELLIRAHYELAQDYIQLGEIRKAQQKSKSVLDKLTATRDQDSGLYSQILSQYAQLNRLSGDLSTALIHINTALKYSQSSSNPSLHIKTLHEAMLIYQKLGKKGEALAYGQKALKEVEQLHQYLEAERLGPAWSKTTHEIYLDVAETFLNDYRQTGVEKNLSQALHIIERSRATTLRQQFIQPRQLEANNAETRQLLTLSKLADVNAANKTTSQDLSYYHQHELLNLTRFNGTKNLPLPPSLTHRQIQEKLKPEQSILYYLMLKKTLYAITISKTKLALQQLGNTDDLKGLLQQARNQMTDINASPYPSLIALSQQLLAPVSIPKNTEDLILVLHRDLHTLPFAALPLISALPAYKPLSSAFDLQVTPSATSYFMNKEQVINKVDSLDLAILANPELSLLTNKTSPHLPVNEQVNTWSQTLPPLPWTAREAANLGKIFSQDKLQIYTGKAANRKNLVDKKVRQARILHIASHGYFYSRNPDNIGFALSASEQQEITTSGFITLTELFSLNFNNELVVISGCDTGMGENMDGEGMLGLSRGFISQGAKHVISTLWPVADKASAKFMQLFYQQLKQLGEVDQALRQAQNNMRAIPSYRHPFYWAGYVLNTVSQDQTISFTHPAS